jgi:hypothetical protein
MKTTKAPSLEWTAEQVRLKIKLAELRILANDIRLIQARAKAVSG